MIQVTALFSIGIMGILFGFSDELGQIIYHSKNASHFIQILAPLIPFLYLDAVVDGMLKGLGQQVYSMIYNVIDSFVSVVLVYFLLPKYAITGYIVVIYITELINFFLSLNRLLTVTDFHFKVYPSVIKPIMGILSSIIMAKVIFPMWRILFPNDILFVAAEILFTACIYLFYLGISSCIAKQDLLWIRALIKS